MADGVDAAVEAVQPTVLHAPGDRALAEAEIHELPPADDPVLPRRHLGEPAIEWGYLRSHTDH